MKFDMIDISSDVVGRGEISNHYVLGFNVSECSMDSEDMVRCVTDLDGLTLHKFMRSRSRGEATIMVVVLKEDWQQAGKRIAAALNAEMEHQEAIEKEKPNGT